MVKEIKEMGTPVMHPPIRAQDKYFVSVSALTKSSCPQAHDMPYINICILITVFQ
jgi:hypothetical protein